MRILTGIDVPFAPFGGSLVYCDDLYSNLPEGVEVRFLTLPPPEGQEKWWSIKDVVFLDIQKAKTQDGFLEYVSRLSELVAQQIEEFQPDIIHCQHLNYGLSRAFAELDTTIPRLGICHGTDVQTATANEFFKDNLVKICDAMDLLLFPNQHMSDDFFALYGKQKPSVINPLGIPDCFFSAKNRQLTFAGDRPFNLLYVGRLLAWKGADIAIESMTHIKYPFTLTVIGNEDQKNFRQQLHDFVEANHLQERVTFQPQLPREKLLQAFAMYDAIVFPSRSLEAFSLTVVEAQAKGLPVIYAGAGGIIDTVGGAGLLIPKNTPAGLATLLDNLYEQPNLLAEVQANGYTNAELYRISVSRDNLLKISNHYLA